MLHRLSWGLFAVIGALGTLMSVRLLFEPSALVGMLAAVAPGTAALATPHGAQLVPFLGRWTAVGLLGENAFTVVVALTALRRGERWAAWLMAYWPLMFLAHFLMYAPGPLRFVQIGWLCLSVPALVVLLVRSSPRA